MRIMGHSTCYYYYYFLWFLLFLTELFVIQTKAQSGFISINCGGENYNDSSNIQWISDINDNSYIDYGDISKIQSNLLTNNVSVPLTTLRYFSKKTKSCYTFNNINNGTSYIVRASFLYGNYDNLNHPPSFALLLNYDVWVANLTTKLTETVTQEIIYLSLLNSLTVCLAPAAAGNNDTPFISTLELRPLSGNINLYQDGKFGDTIGPALPNGYGLQVIHRINYGASSSEVIRYPDDDFDRIWEANTTGTKLSTSADNINSNSASDPQMVPAKVMATAIATPNNSPNYTLTFDFPEISGTLGFRIDLHFAELASNVSDRVVSIYLSGANIGDTANRLNTEFTPTTASLDLTATISSPYLQVQLAGNGSYGPLLNAIQVMKWTSGPLATTGTFVDDYESMLNLQEEFNIQSNGGGDPCIPSNFGWSWTTCSNQDTIPRIVGLNLMKYNLHGNIPSDINRLNQLVKIDLSDNMLNGTIPDLSALYNLQVLDLHGNNLSGEIPSSLVDLPQLKRLNVINNSLCGDISSFLSKQSLTMMFDESPHLCVGCKCPKTTPNLMNKWKIIIIVASVVSISMLAFGVLFLYKLRLKMNKNKNENMKDDYIMNEPFTKDNRSMFLNTRCFNYEEIVDATKHFSIKLGEGGFGPVFKGVLRNGEEVAVKMMLNKSQYGIQQFLTEVDILSKVRHKNLVSLLGICIERAYMLIYKYIPNGSLYDILHCDKQRKSNSRLPWSKRLQIAIGISQGLEYLHTSCQPSIIHRDIKSKNILLDDNMIAKVADFGLSKFKKMDDVSHVSTTCIAGTIGYLDPMYHNTTQLTYKSDIYSFGVVLLELICNKPPIFQIETTPTHIGEWVRMSILEGNLEDLVDPFLINKNNVDSICSTLDVALQCVEYDRNSRPYIDEVVIKLKEAEKLQMEENL